MEVLYHIRPYFGGISPYIGLKNRPKIYGRYLQFRFLKWPLNILARQWLYNADKKNGDF